MTLSLALDEYKQITAHSAVEEASPHRLIQMLFEGLLDRLNLAKGHIARKDLEEKTRYLDMSLSIIGGLQASLDMDKGGEVAKNLDALYDYMTMQLFKANAENKAEYVEEVANLVREIKSAWDEIGDQS